VTSHLEQLEHHQGDMFDINVWFCSRLWLNVRKKSTAAHIRKTTSVRGVFLHCGEDSQTW